MENKNIKNKNDKKSNNIKKQYEKPRIVHSTEIEAMAGSCDFNSTPQSS